jgi:MATE family multidrug resistance protein
LSVAANIGWGIRKAWRLQTIAHCFSIFLLAILLESVFALVFIVFTNIYQLCSLNNVTDLAINTEVVFNCSATVISELFFKFLMESKLCRCPSWSSDVKIPMYITFVAYWVVGFPVSIYLGMYTDLKAGNMDWSLAGLSTAAVFLYIRFNSLTKS